MPDNTQEEIILNKLNNANKRQCSIEYNIDTAEEPYKKFEGAVAKADTQAVESLIADGIDVNHLISHIDDYGEEFYYPAIHVAIMTENEDMTRLLIDAGATVNTCWPSIILEVGSMMDGVIKWTPLYSALFACEHYRSDESFNVLNLLLDFNADTETCYIIEQKTGEKSYFPAIKNVIGTVDAFSKEESYDNNYEFSVIDTLVEHGADINRTIPGKGKEYPLLFFAILTGNELLVEKLISSGASWDTEIYDCEYGKYSMKKFPINKYVSDVGFLRFLRQNGWKGPGLFGWKT